MAETEPEELSLQQLGQRTTWAPSVRVGLVSEGPGSGEMWTITLDPRRFRYRFLSGLEDFGDLLL